MSTDSIALKKNIYKPVVNNFYDLKQLKNDQR